VSPERIFCLSKLILHSGSGGLQSSQKREICSFLRDEDTETGKEGCDTTARRDGGMKKWIGVPEKRVPRDEGSKPKKTPQSE
jgi:hypothetical protein